MEKTPIRTPIHRPFSIDEYMRQNTLPIVAGRLQEQVDAAMGKSAALKIGKSMNF